MILVENLRLVNFSSRRAEADVRFDNGVLIKGFAVVKDGDKAAWVAPPQSCWLNKEGKKVYNNIVELPPDVMAAVKAALLDAWAASKEGTTNG